MADLLRHLVYCLDLQNVPGRLTEVIEELDGVISSFNCRCKYEPQQNFT